MVGKRSVPEVATAAAVVWRSMTQEEKDVSPIPISSRLSAIDVETSSSDINLGPQSQLLPRITRKVSEPSGPSPTLCFSSDPFCLCTLPRSPTLLPNSLL